MLWLFTSSPHIVHVVSILDVPTILGSANQMMSVEHETLKYDSENANKNQNHIQYIHNMSINNGCVIGGVNSVIEHTFLVHFTIPHLGGGGGGGEGGGRAPPVFFNVWLT